jgi:diguanylate cyclase (GGDEF)-like protein
MSFTGRFLAYLERQSRGFLRLVILVAVLGLGVIDYESGPYLSLSLFYIFPVALASWTLGLSEGLLTSFICAVIWNAANPPINQSLISLYPMGNAVERLGILIVFSLLFSELHALLKNESQPSHKDDLTGIPNRRAIYETMALEMKRLARKMRPFTLIYMDLDNFKLINDSAGHAVGDSVLAEIATMLKLQLRGIDTVARMGGDEFAMILPETNELAARKVAPRLQSSLLQDMLEHHWPVTFSMGVLTFISAPSNTNEMFQLADQLMYRAKKEGKNTICYEVHSG